LKTKNIIFSYKKINIKYNEKLQIKSSAHLVVVGVLESSKLHFILLHVTIGVVILEVLTKNVYTNYITVLGLLITVSANMY